MLREIIEKIGDKPNQLSGYKKAWHVGNPHFRKEILKNGLVPQIGASYSAHYDTDHMGPVIFFSLDKNKLFDSTYDDDLYEINIPKNLEYFEDPSMLLPNAYTKETIKPKYFKLIHKGTGESSW